ncbi:MAG: hypothetical protein FWB80_13450 [Defluviitaleaceae bacterium]|nr:hypothetical protein [Defluviitaleaceae bacterium]
MSPHEIYIIHLSWGSDGKIRPVLVFIVDEDTVDIYQITTQYENKSEHIKSQYFKINDPEQAGLNKASYIDTGTLISLPKDAFKGKTPVGILTDGDKQRFLKFLK